ncbi:uncharacterized protein METZ01_LOCUS393794, partial [marine metagenome]
ASRLQREGRRFDPCQLHKIFVLKISFVLNGVAF